MLEAAARQGLDEYEAYEDDEEEVGEEDVMISSHCSTVAARTVVIVDVDAKAVVVVVASVEAS